MQTKGFIAAAVIAGLLPAASARAATATVPFAATGHEQAFTVPAGVTSLHVVAIGAAGGAGSEAPAGAPGKVELVTCTTRRTKTTCKRALVSGPLKLTGPSRGRRCCTAARLSPAAGRCGCS